MGPADIASHMRWRNASCHMCFSVLLSIIQLIYLHPSPEFSCLPSFVVPVARQTGTSCDRKEWEPTGRWTGMSCGAGGLTGRSGLWRKQRVRRRRGLAGGGQGHLHVLEGPLTICNLF